MHVRRGQESVKAQIQEIHHNILKQFEDISIAKGGKAFKVHGCIGYRPLKSFNWILAEKQQNLAWRGEV